MADPKIKPLSAGKRAKLEKKRAKLEKKLREIEALLSAPPKVKAGKPKKATRPKKGGSVTRDAKTAKRGRKPQADGAVSTRE